MNDIVLYFDFFCDSKRKNNDLFIIIFDFFYFCCNVYLIINWYIYFD